MKIFVLILCGILSGSCEVLKDVEDRVFFRVFEDYKGNYINATKNSGCKPNEKYSIIVHGWTNTMNEEWIQDLIKNLFKYRGGCIMLYDYSHYTRTPYVDLVDSFDSLTLVLANKLHQLENEGLSPDNGVIFGFSLGSRIAIDGAGKFGVQKVKEIYVCDSAGPGFDFEKETIDPKLAAQNTQCIHTSADLGTFDRKCHQNWNMGCCGYYQLAEFEGHYSSHALCPYFMNLSFEKRFYAVPNVYNCSVGDFEKTWPEGYFMGYMESFERKSKTSGNFFALTAYENSSYIADLAEFQDKNSHGYLKCDDLNGLTKRLRSKFNFDLL